MGNGCNVSFPLTKSMWICGWPDFVLENTISIYSFLCHHVVHVNLWHQKPPNSAPFMTIYFLDITLTDLKQTFSLDNDAILHSLCSWYICTVTVYPAQMGNVCFDNICLDLLNYTTMRVSSTHHLLPNMARYSKNPQMERWKWWLHLSVTESLNTDTSTVCSITCSCWEQRKHQSVTLLAICDENPLVTCGFPSSMTSNADSVSMS